MTDLNDFSTEELEKILVEEEKKISVLQNKEANLDEKKAKEEIKKWEEEEQKHIEKNHTCFVTSNPKRHLSINIYTDPACEMFDRTPIEEAAWIEKDLREYIGNPMTFKYNVEPHNLGNCDIYIFDVGGLGAMYEDIMTAHYRTLYKKIEDMPNTIFIMWSTYTKQYDEIIWAEVMGDIGAKDRHNVLHRTRKEEIWLKKCLKLLG